MSSTPAVPDIAVLTDQVVSLLMTQKLGADLDLREIKGHSEISRYLRRAFEAPYAPLINAAEAVFETDPHRPDSEAENPAIPAGDNAALLSVLRMLATQNAALQADLFLIKAALQRDNRYVADYAAGYSDPLVMARALMDETGHAAMVHRAVSIFLPFDNRVLGSGWHAAQKSPDGQAFRWMSRHKDVSVVLPAFGPGKHSFEMEYEVLLPEQVKEITVSMDGAPLEFSHDRLTEKTGVLRFANTVEPGRSTAFQMLDMTISGPVRPSDYGMSDNRILGLKTHGFQISYAGSEA